MRLDEYLKAKSVTQKAFAATLNVCAVTVSNWATGSRPVPANRCMDIERETGGAVRCEDLRPDLAWGVVRGAVAAPQLES